MHTTVDYTNRLTKAFDAVEDIKNLLGIKKWDEVSPLMAQVTDVRQFTLLADLGGVRGYPVEAWYDLYHGQGAFADRS